MADDERPKQQADDPFASLDISADHDATDWGEDWEAAFKADDATFFTPEEGETEGFFLEEEPKPSAAPTPLPPGEALKQSLASIPDQATPEAPSPFAAILDQLKSVPAGLLIRLQAFPPRLRYALYALPLLLLILGLLPFLLQSPAKPPAQPQETALQEAATVGGPPPSPTEPTPAAPPTESTAPPSGDQATPALPAPEKIRRKWAFPSFLIPTTAGPGQPVTFVVVDLTLVASLDKAEETPPDKLALIRDAIFQFYQNRPVEELRRYSLARGEMTRKLKEWITHQWPEAPIESITFERYHLS